MHEIQGPFMDIKFMQELQTLELGCGGLRVFLGWTALSLVWKRSMSHLYITRENDLVCRGALYLHPQHQNVLGTKRTCSSLLQAQVGNRVNKVFRDLQGQENTESCSTTES